MKRRKFILHGLTIAAVAPIPAVVIACSDEPKKTNDQLMAESTQVVTAYVETLKAGTEEADIQYNDNVDDDNHVVAFIAISDKKVQEAISKIASLRTLLNKLTRPIYDKIWSVLEKEAKTSGRDKIFYLDKIENLSVDQENKTFVFKVLQLTTPAVKGLDQSDKPQIPFSWQTSYDDYENNIDADVVKKVQDKILENKHEIKESAKTKKIEANNFVTFTMSAFKDKNKNTISINIPDATTPTTNTWKDTETQIRIGDNKAQLPNLENELVGMKKGETKTIEYTLDSYLKGFDANKKPIDLEEGTTISLTITIDKVETVSVINTMDNISDQLISDFKTKGYGFVKEDGTTPITTVDGLIDETTREYIKKQTEKNVDAVIEQVNAAIKTYNETTEDLITTPRQLKSGDRIVFDYKGSINGEVFEGGTAEDTNLVLGGGQFIKSLEDALMTLQSDATSVTVQAAFPDNYDSEKLAGKEADWEITIKKLFAKMDTISTKTDFDSISQADWDKLKIKDKDGNLIAHADKQTNFWDAKLKEAEDNFKKMMKDQFLSKLMKKVMDKNPDIKAPTVFVDMQIGIWQRNMFAQLGERIKQIPDEQWNGYKEREKAGITQRFIQQLVLREFMKAENIEYFKYDDQIRDKRKALAKATEPAEEEKLKKEIEDLQEQSKDHKYQEVDKLVTKYGQEEFTKI